MKQPEFRIIKVHGRNKDLYQLLWRGVLWGWNKIPRNTYYDHADYDYVSVEECLDEIQAICRERKENVIVKEIYTDELGQMIEDNNDR